MAWKETKTCTPMSMYAKLMGLFLLLCLVFATICSLVGVGFFVGIIATFILVALKTNLYTITVPGYFAGLLLDNLTSKQRVIFQGLNFKLPWEDLTTSVDLRSELSDVCKESWETDEGAEMDAQYVYIMHPQNNTQAILNFCSFEPSMVKRSARALFTMMLSDHFGSHKPKELLNKEKINREVFESIEGCKAINAFENEHGVEVHVRLEDVDFDADTKKARDRITNARSFAEAVRILVTESHMDQKNAEQIAKLENFDTVKETTYKVDVSGLDNLQHLNVVGIPGEGGKK